MKTRIATASKPAYLKSSDRRISKFGAWRLSALGLFEFNRIFAGLFALPFFCSFALADPFSIDGTAPNRWPAVISFSAPCGIQMQGTTDTSSWFPPLQIDSAAANNPSSLCASTMRTLTDPDNTSVTSIGAVNPAFTKLPDGSALPSVVDGTLQDPQNAPTSIIEASASGSMVFLVPVSFRDTSDTSFDGEADGVLESPYDATQCPDPVGPNALPQFSDPFTGLRTLSTVPFTCVITTPTQYLNVLKQGHAIRWAQFTQASFVAYGPTDFTMPSGAQPWQRQTHGGQVHGMLNLPYETTENSTVIRIGVRYSIGYQGQIPFTWGGWPTPFTCSQQSRRAGTCIVPTNGWAGMQTAWIYSQPFTVQVQPVSLVQFHVLPVTLIYNPPGNQSSASISTTETTTQSYQVDQNLTITDQGDYDTKTKSDLSFSPAFKLSSYGVSGNFDTSTTWDNSGRTTTGAAYAQRVSSATSFGKSASYATAKKDPSDPDVAHLTYQTEPFWSDKVIVAVNPQYAVWEYPDPRGQNPKGQTLLQAMGSSAIKQFTIQQLVNCLPAHFGEKGGMSFNYDVLAPDNSTVKKTDSLSWQECAKLLALDPFFVGRSQSAPPKPSTGMSVPPAVRSLSTGIETDQASYITTNSTQASATNTTKATLTSAMQNTLTKGLKVQYGTYPVPVVSNTINPSSSTTTGFTDSNEVDVALGTTESSQTQQSLVSSISLADCPLVNNKSTCSALPPGGFPNVEVFQDLRFGTFMAVLPDLNIAPPPADGHFAPKLAGDLQNAGINASHFALPHSEVESKPLTITRGTPIHVGGPPGPGPVTRAGPMEPLTVKNGTASPLPATWQGRVFNTARQPTIDLVPLAAAPVARPVPMILSPSVQRPPSP